MNRVLKNVLLTLSLTLAGPTVISFLSFIAALIAFSLIADNLVWAIPTGMFTFSMTAIMATAMLANLEKLVFQEK